ncbi:hypothetical protein [Lactococcus kimchii]|uniref:hypothetical protein n=1 Tax=Lactococcus sp. S-13 TaxID=2507158 RepID=UPI0010230795|nr:hypothetical protein [Lactococcus sp. S-13]RZI49659.1 hypothetical protein EQJ87_09605 [Lactococcus sp. S-13]
MEKQNFAPKTWERLKNREKMLTQIYVSKKVIFLDKTAHFVFHRAEKAKKAGNTTSCSALHNLILYVVLS